MQSLQDQKYDSSNAADGVAPYEPVIEGDVTNSELPDDLRIPLHELQADASYLVGRVAVDGSMGGMILQVLETKLSHVAEASYRLNGSRNDLLEALKLIDVICNESPGELRKRMGTRIGNIMVAARSAIAKAEGK